MRLTYLGLCLFAGCSPTPSFVSECLEHSKFKQTNDFLIVLDRLTFSLLSASGNSLEYLMISSLLWLYSLNIGYPCVQGLSSERYNHYNLGLIPQTTLLNILAVSPGVRDV